MFFPTGGPARRKVGTNDERGLLRWLVGPAPPRPARTEPSPGGRTHPVGSGDDPLAELSGGGGDAVK